MMKYKCNIDFDGSPDGCKVRTFKDGQIYDHADFGDDLVEVALEMKWIDEVDGGQEDEPQAQVVEVTLEMIKDGMTVKEMLAALKEANIITRAKKEDTLANLILKHQLFGG